MTQLGEMSDANFPKDEFGHVYHLGIGPGDVANRIIMVGDTHRAKLLADSIEGYEIYSDYTPPRLFRIITGTYKGIKLSIVGTLMGIANMDFCVREIRAVTKGPLYLIRLGTCGTPSDEVSLGDVVLADKCVGIIRNPNFFHSTEEEKEGIDPYIFTKPVEASKPLFSGLKSEVELCLKSFESISHVGVDASADSFYSSQGRIDSAFDDENEAVIGDLMKKYPETKSLEMESFTLFDLATCCRKSEIHAASVAIVIAQRKSGEFLETSKKVLLSRVLGIAIADTLVGIEA
ncbi:hypothetical protein ADUPG1_000168 [Aduncisulcus paluster]|uniref:Nucleoside phosphorylase domain-containing protein n=1 Tax=Aduncisulcus paluster TaxID=2918883 RepID=A0ABQ5K5A3_9EUKA|nr:hypothetical protein ADUPG1_000168 [Aduncisulcus paluster]|eukprot:gnl/Carplike_NY0171/5785_a7931_184.p1 GENE.gnl/Carplike_NY0171/5785_a7931_184~~gnl/Carplike_NY0171/5785_a7931_184.p1  ORF type:complete len:290 (-),score=74.95 gnl/Carplike_NY0171/5785_a7931_184:78-947(-)